MNTFFIELLKRFLAKNPKFFKTLQIIAIALGAISGVLSFLQAQNIDLPSWFAWLSDTVVKVVSLVTIILAQLPNEDPNTTAKK